MNKSELIAAAAERSGMTKKDTELVVNAVLSTITSTLLSDERVQLSGFGIFEIKKRQSRIGRNPHTKEPVEIPPTRALAFKPCKALKDTIGNNHDET